MKKVSIALIFALGLAGAAALAQDTEHKVKMSELPPAVQHAVSDYATTRSATVRGLAAEVENGKKLFEAEMRVNGRNRDVTFDESGAIFSLEEETTLDKIPAPARAAIEKAAAGGRIALVESVTENGTTFYEGHITKGGKSSEAKVNAAGEAVK